MMMYEGSLGMRWSPHVWFQAFVAPWNASLLASNTTTPSMHLRSASTSQQFLGCKVIPKSHKVYFACADGGDSCLKGPLTLPASG